MKKAVVTGGAGFIGSNLVDKLIEQGIEVNILDNLSTGKEKNINPKAFFQNIDLSEPIPSVLFRDADVVFHFAATPNVQYSVENPTDDNNISTTVNVLEASRKSKVKRLVFSSTCALYGNPIYVPTNEIHPINPLSPYALDKRIGEQYCKLYSDIYGLDTVCLRYFNVYGNRMVNEGAYRSVISVFKEQHDNNQPLNIVNDGEQKRDFIHVDDIIQANILCGSRKNNFNSEIYNVGTGKSYTVNEIADMFGGEKKYGEKRIEPKESIANNTKITLGLEWKPKGDLHKFIKKYKNQ